MHALSSGDRLGPYEVIAAIGAGGMGDVYKARDTRLDRLVALKVSKEQFTERFQTEARATAALDHPHICRLYDVCQERDASFLVMEFVDGIPLKGPLPIEQALLYAGQIANALDEAHRKHIVHRDLKPSNILVTPKGGVKLLDFGLAKVGANNRDTPLDDAALTRGVTAAGTILGTLHYMAPEQLQGAVADARSDIFAFGLVLYEMLTGKRAFDGSSAASIIAAIIERPAPSIVDVAPPALDRILKRCLAKDPDDRWQSAGDIKAALDLVTDPTTASTPAAATPTAPVGPRGAFIGRGSFAWVAAAVLGVALAALALVHFRETPPAPEMVRFQISPPLGTRIVSSPFVSPDGRLVAFLAATTDGERRIWVRRLDTLESRALPGTESASENLFWSSDSRFIAFSADRKLKTIDSSGTPIRTVSDMEFGNIGGGAWNKDGVIVFSAFREGLFRISASGGTATRLTSVSAAEIVHVLPSFLPDGQRVLYVAAKRDGTTVAHVIDLNGMESVQFPIEARSRVVYVPSTHARSGHLVFNRGDSLVAQRVDEQTLAATGDVEVVVDNIGDTPNPGSAPGFYSVSDVGTLAYLAGDIRRPTRLVWFDRAGKPIGNVGDEALYNDISLSPDDARLAVTRAEGNNEDIWLIDLVRNVPTRFTFDTAQDWHPVWSPDGRRIAFSSTRQVGGRINSVFWKDVVNVSADQLVLQSAFNERLNDWSPDGRLLLVNRTEGRDDLWIVPVEPDTAGGERKPVAYLQSPFTETRGQFFPVSNPGGHAWIAYTSNESGQNEIYVESFPRGTQKERISTNGGIQPRWRKDGRELFYISPDRELMSVSVTMTGSNLSFGTPTELFRTRLSMGGTLVFRMLRYDATRDGRRFLINTEAESSEPASAPIMVVMNWQAMLRK